DIRADIHNDRIAVNRVDLVAEHLEHDDHVEFMTAECQFPAIPETNGSLARNGVIQIVLYVRKRPFEHWPSFRDERRIPQDRRQKRAHSGRQQCLDGSASELDRLEVRCASTYLAQDCHESSCSMEDSRRRPGLLLL